jgi:Endomembrane protein 70
VKVNKLTSIKTQLPYSYYSLPYCKPNVIVDSAENLGEVLRGDRIENSPYVVSILIQLISANFGYDTIKCYYSYNDM